jgi:radical SAM superfamily enzyme YgiQ (UPF0313 family)
MKVLLVNPPSETAIKEYLGAAAPPIGLASLAAVAIQEGCKVKVVDAVALNFDFHQLEKEISKFKPEVVGVTATTPGIYSAYRVAEIGKELGCHTVIGGPHATFMDVEVITECDAVDVVVRGEGEVTFSQLLDAFEKDKLSDVAGITFRDGEMIVRTPKRKFVEDLDTLPVPAFDFLPKYYTGNSNFGAVMTSRGCPYCCVFCSSSRLFGNIWRGHSADRVVEELSLLNEMGIRNVEFMDDTFNVNKRRAIEISKKIRQERLDISWISSSRVDTFNVDAAREMRKAGCHSLYFGIESGSQRILDFIGKNISVEKAEKAVKKAKELGFRVIGSFVIGFHHEKVEEMDKTIKLARKLPLDFAQFTIATPYPGTKLYEIASRLGLLFTRDWRRYTTLEPVMKNIHVDARQIQAMLSKAYLSFYLRPRYLLKDVTKNKGFVLRRIFSRALPNIIRDGIRTVALPI